MYEHIDSGEVFSDAYISFVYKSWIIDVILFAKVGRQFVSLSK
jgi:hypothetical protein